jgi:hypothetical protein
MGMIPPQRLTSWRIGPVVEVSAGADTIQYPDSGIGGRPDQGCYDRYLPTSEIGKLGDQDDSSDPR